MTSGYPPWTSCSANTPPLSSSTASIIVPRKKGDSSRQKQHKLKGRATEDTTNGDYDAREGLYVQYLPLSPDPTTLSGQSTGQDASTRYASQSPAHSSHYRSEVVPEVVVVSTLRTPKAKSSQSAGKTASVGHKHKPSALKTYQRKGNTAKTDKDAGHKTHKKTHDPSQRTTPGKQQSRTGVMVGPKAVTREDLKATLGLEQRLKKRPRVEEKNSSLSSSNKTAKSGSDSRSTKKSDYHTAKKLKLTHSTATTTIVKAASSSTSHKHSLATSGVRTVLSKQHRTLITYNRSPQGSKATSHVTGANGSGGSAPSRFRVKEKIDYRVKLALTLNPPEPKPPGPKSKGKAVRKKINPAGSDVPVVKRAPSPFPAWHRTTSALNKAGIAEVEMKDVEEIPEDDCYVYMPIYEPKTKLTEPELIPDRFDLRLNHPALQVKDLLRRAVPLKCGWKDCDAFLACEPMLDKHINKCGHISKALVVHREYFEPDAWVCQWEGCGERAFATEDHLQQHVKAVHVGAVLPCPYDNCNEEPAGFPKMSLLGIHVRKSHPPGDSSRSILKPLVGANDNKTEPKRHSEPLPQRSQPFQSLYIPVSRAVWKSEPRKKQIIDLVSDRSFIDKLDVRMQAGKIEMNAGIISDPEHSDTMSDTDIDADLPEGEEVWKDHEPDYEMASDPAAQVPTSAGPILGPLPIPQSLNASDGPSGSTTPATDMQKRRSNRLKDGGEALLSKGLVSNSLRDPRDPGYCILIPVTREWVSLPDGPESL